MQVLLGILEHKYRGVTLLYLQGRLLYCIKNITIRGHCAPLAVERVGRMARWVCWHLAQMLAHIAWHVEGLGQLLG